MIQYLDLICKIPESRNTGGRPELQQINALVDATIRFPSKVEDYCLIKFENMRCPLPPSPNRPRAAMARSVELTMTRPLVKLANKNLGSAWAASSYTSSNSDIFN